jgi:hypothetical protein
LISLHDKLKDNKLTLGIALEADSLLPQSGILANYYSINKRNINTTLAMEELGAGLIALIVAGLVALVIMVKKFLSWLMGDSNEISNSSVTSSVGGIKEVEATVKLKPAEILKRKERVLVQIDKKETAHIGKINNYAGSLEKSITSLDEKYGRFLNDKDFLTAHTDIFHYVVDHLNCDIFFNMITFLLKEIDHLDDSPYDEQNKIFLLNKWKSSGLDDFMFKAPKLIDVLKSKKTEPEKDTHNSIASDGDFSSGMFSTVVAHLDIDKYKTVKKQSVKTMKEVNDTLEYSIEKLKKLGDNKGIPNEKKVLLKEYLSKFSKAITMYTSLAVESEKLTLVISHSIKAIVGVLEDTIRLKIMVLELEGADSTYTDPEVIKLGVALKQIERLAS